MTTDGGAAERRVLAADVGGSFIRMAAVGGADDVGAVKRRPTPADDLTGFADALGELIGELETATGIGRDAPLALATAGIVDPDNGLALAANIPCFTGEPVAERLSAALGRPVGLINDADAFALAEATAGVGRGQRIVFGAILGTGVGGGLVVDGRLVRGAGGFTGEWGHGPIANPLPQNTDGPLPRMACGCGQVGCADTFGGARGLERLHLALGHPAADSHAIVAAWTAGKPAAGRTVALWAELLCEPLALTINLTGASIVATGGGLGSDPALVALLDREVRARILRRLDTPLLTPGRLENAALVGAAILARQIGRGA
ncbi:ROK family protein [Aurantimonas sp. MSK8Z-1]|uniref:ROK family protein n=1 Tax=Mangrovibrevibacter kandeliae TaxID=2968473 RepID=UPI0021196E4A|nr:ROK family protein [Aurantimonas sp. MSK8Z-1]MCW4116447.1 ROK family protein [Aurantimonas sp. MSK8Z-1]